MYSERRSWSACLTALHSATILSRLLSRVQEESAMSAAPLMMLSSLSSREGRVRTSLYSKGLILTRSCQQEVQTNLNIVCNFLPWSKKACDNKYDKIMYSSIHNLNINTYNSYFDELIPIN